MWLLDNIGSLIKRIANRVQTLEPSQYRRDYLVDDIRKYIKYKDPLVRSTLTECSIIEDSENPMYAGILNTLANHCVGTVPLLVSLLDDDGLNEEIENLWMEWASNNNIGAAIRLARRTAAQTGIAILIPYKMQTDYKMKLGLKVVGSEFLKAPTDPLINAPEGIEYWENGDVKRVFIQEYDQIEPTPYDARSVIIWWKRSRPFATLPECAPAFSVYPSINRYLQNIMREAELKSAIPMAVELDGEFYRPGNTAIPKGSFKYEPGMVPTLPPGTRLVGINYTAMAEDRGKLTDHLTSVAARCIDMPKVLAISSSSDSNMATAHIDLQPWKYVVDIDRFDYEPAIRKIARIWYRMALNLLPSQLELMDEPKVLFNYTVLFNHPDPMKCANARAKDLESGASTLTAIYSDQGKVARREIRKECKLLGITTEEFYERLLATRSGVKNDQTSTDQNEDDSEQDKSKAGSVSGV